MCDRVIMGVVICRLDYQQFVLWYCSVLGDCGSTVVKVMCYKSGGRWFDPI